jgi:trehalose synthase
MIAADDKLDTLTTVEVGSLSLSRFESLLAPEEFDRVRAGAQRAATQLSGRKIWNVSSTARGGGVAEMLVSLLAYARGASVDARWAVIGGDTRFFAITKRLHNRLHGFDSDGGALDEDERRDYEATLAANAAALSELICPGDVVILHDPQTAGLIEPIRALGVPVVWRCHVGVDTPNTVVRSAWRFLEPYVRFADAVVFSRQAFAWDVVDVSRTVIISPSIDAYSPKNQAMDELTAECILTAAGIRAGHAGHAAFTRMEGVPDVVRRRATTIEERRLRAEDRYVLQVSRWDALKDPAGVIAGFAEHIAPCTDVHLVYAGPAVDAVSDDPEGEAVFKRAHEQWTALPEQLRARIHLALLPMDDPQENAAMVNALQRGADVVVQKSLAEGFGLTVAEAMWKSRPVVASRLGGIQDQIAHGVSGLLLDDPSDLEAFGNAVVGLLSDPDAAAAMGSAAKQSVREHYLAPHSLLAYSELLGQLLDTRGTTTTVRAAQTTRAFSCHRDDEQEIVMEETGSYRSPSVEHARVSDAMNNAIVTCSPEAGLREMGRMMANRHIHSLVVSLGDPERWALVSDVALAQSAISRPDATAEDLAVAATGISTEATLARAIEVMRDQGTSHLIVTDIENGQPTGMISALDIAGILAWGEG